MENMVGLKIPNKKFWMNKKIFLTGHTSFKGSWLKLWLEMMGAKVTGYSLNYPSYPKCLYKIFYKEKLVKESILNYKKLKKKIMLTKPKIVFHFAAQSILSQANEKPLENYKTNIIGTAGVLEACAYSKNTKLVVIVTTDKCYEEDSKKKFYDEKSNLGGSEPYSVSKACAELISKSYLNKYKKLNKKIITLRAGNVIGGGDWKKNRLVPDIFKAILSKSSLLIRNPNHIRPWQHVLDCINGYLIASEYSYNKNVTFNSWNFAPPLKNQVKVLKFVNILFDRFNINKQKIIVKNKKKFYESKKLNLIANKAKKDLKWNTVLSQNKVIDFIYEWYDNYKKKNNMKKFSMYQIKKFSETAIKSKK